jgi:hypothetical protein
MLRSVLLLALLVTTCGAALAQQPARPLDSNDSMSADKSATTRRRSSQYPLGSPEEEMLKRNEIRITEKGWEENLERAREVVQLSKEVRNAYTSNKTFSRLEIKKLERLEKLARRIRSQAGGSDDDESPAQSTPQHIESALKLLAETSDEVFKGVEKTHRMVVSAGVIERANEMLEIIRYLRTYTRQQ